MSTRFVRVAAVSAVLLSIFGGTAMARRDGGALPSAAALRSAPPRDVPAVTTSPASSPGIQFVHVATASNSAGDYDNHRSPLTNGNPNAILIVTPNWNPGGVGGTYNNHPVGVWYDGGKWAIFNQDLTAIPVARRSTSTCPARGGRLCAHGDGGQQFRRLHNHRQSVDQRQPQCDPPRHAELESRRCRRHLQQSCHRRVVQQWQMGHLQPGSDGDARGRGVQRLRAHGRGGRLCAHGDRGQQLRRLHNHRQSADQRQPQCARLRHAELESRRCRRHVQQSPHRRVVQRRQVGDLQPGPGGRARGRRVQCACARAGLGRVLCTRRRRATVPATTQPSTTR